MGSQTSHNPQLKTQIKNVSLILMIFALTIMITSSQVLTTVANVTKARVPPPGYSVVSRKITGALCLAPRVDGRIVTLNPVENIGGASTCG